MARAPERPQAPRLPTTLLFAPASDARLLAKARASRAGAVIADLEDGVADERKPEARENLARALVERRDAGLQIVRVNEPLDPLGGDDLEALRGLCVDAVMVPKATPAQLQALPAATPPVIALVETALGLREAIETARHPAVVALMLGTVDLCLDLGCADSSSVLDHAAASLIIDAKAAGIEAIDGVCTAIDDEALLRREATRARSLGYRAKACIHPRQLEIVREAMAGPESERAWAERALAAYEAGVAAGEGAISLDGQMVDLPVAERARQVLRRTADCLS